MKTDELQFNCIMAATKDGLIGINEAIPWYIPEDLKMFKRLTTHGIVIMGKSTWDSLPNKPLQNRLNVVLTHKLESFSAYRCNDEVVAIDYDQNPGEFYEFLRYAKTSYNDIWVIGGSGVFNTLFPFITKMTYVTINLDIPTKDGDVCSYIPTIDTMCNTHNFSITTRPTASSEYSTVYTLEKQHS